VVLNDADEVLMLWRHRFMDDSRRWQLPCGIVDGDEDGAATATHEVEEEPASLPRQPTIRRQHPTAITLIPGKRLRD